MYLRVYIRELRFFLSASLSLRCRNVLQTTHEKRKVIQEKKKKIL